VARRTNLQIDLRVKVYPFPLTLTVALTTLGHYRTVWACDIFSVT